jgi:hypothetical protein
MEFPPLMAALFALPTVILAFSFQENTAALVSPAMMVAKLEFGVRNVSSTMDAKNSFRSDVASGRQSQMSGTLLKNRTALARGSGTKAVLMSVGAPSKCPTPTLPP